MLSKRISAFICAFALAAGYVLTLPEGDEPVRVYAAGDIISADGSSSSNGILTEPQYYDNQDKTVKSYLYESGENQLTRVEYTGSSLIAEDINMKTGKLIKSRTLDMSLPLFGGFYAGKDYNFVITGQSNYEESNDTKVFAVTRYSKDFKSSKTVYLYGRNTVYPFKAGSCRMTEAGGKLYIHTCHLMYKNEKDGYNHQANMSYVVDEATLDFLQENYLVGSSFSVGKLNNAFGYSSHSFDQFIAADDNAVYVYDHGDAHPRALRVHKYTLSDGYLSYSDLVSIPGETGDNYTSVLTGAMVLSKDNVIIGVKMDDMTAAELKEYDELKDVYIITAPKSSIGSSDISKTVNLTNYTSAQKSSGLRNSAPKITKINDDKFIVMWKECKVTGNWWEEVESDAVTKIAVIDGNGKLVGSVLQSSEIALSDCDPVLCSDSLVRWYTTNGSSPVLYALDPDDPAKFGSSHLPGDADSNGTVDISDALLMQQYIAGWNVKIDLESSDVTGDDNITVEDVLLLQQSIAGWNVTLK